MAAELVAGAAVGAVFGELLKAVLEMKDKAIMFKPTLTYLRSTLEAIAPVIQEIEQQNNELGRPKEELERLIRGMEDGTKLVYKCSKIQRWNYVAKIRYQDQLVLLGDSLVRFFIIDMQAQTARDQKETLLKVRRMFSRLMKMPLVEGTEEITGSSSDSVPAPVADYAYDSDCESFYSMPTELAEDETEIIEDMSNVGLSDDQLTAPVAVLSPARAPRNPNNNSVAQQSQRLQIIPSPILLHGYLNIWDFAAKNLPKKWKSTNNLYVTISVSNTVIGRTSTCSKSENPIWMEHLYLLVAHYATEVNFAVKCSDVMGLHLIGIATIPVEEIKSGKMVQGTIPILNPKPQKQGALLSLSIQYIPTEKLSIYHEGIRAAPDYNGVPGTYFPLRKGGTVTLYQDAHVPDGCLPSVVLDNGMYYVHGKCWQDIFNAILQAHYLIYITGWSVWHKVRLVRDAGTSDFTLGNLLKSKSQEGVRVLLLIWKDPTSINSNIFGSIDGIMGTHGEETRQFFKNSSVQVLLCSHGGKKGLGTIYTHHQKTVIVDADAGNCERKIVAFLGGLDLCHGRYDTPYHPLFRTLQTLHRDDYHNPTFTGYTGGCAGDPWHDMHCKIDGPAAYDVLTNFEERWLKASRSQGLKILKNSYEDALLRLERIPNIIGMFDDPSVSGSDPESWHVQIFRSIDSNSVKGFPKDPKHATRKNLVCGKNVLIDMSIHTAYVNAIRAAQHYIYIENQYFIGSSYNWIESIDLGANNLIPMEIALKIAQKIRANERFAVYIVIPMWPVGLPTGFVSQRILFLQHKTMQMMYKIIYEALVDKGLEAESSPEDYLNFFCLGNLKAIDINDNFELSGTLATTNSPQAPSGNKERSMIYVHSKGMIVDDEYVMLGSANINQRSMGGTRDTEIVMGAYQPYHTWDRTHSYPRGQIHGYRMSLWAEHMGEIEPFFWQPDSLECVRRVVEIGKTNWKQFAADEMAEMKGHLLKYPVEVDRQGRVRALPDQQEFPDYGGSIIGSFVTG